jgi:AsmA protein
MSSATTESTPRRPVSIGLDEVSVQDGTIAYRDDRIGAFKSFGVPTLTATAPLSDDRLHVEASGTFNDSSFSVVAETGDLARLQDRLAGQPWPVKVALTSGAAQLSVEGSVLRPLQAQGYVLTVQGAVPDLATLAPLLPGTTLPPVHDITMSAAVADRGDGEPEVRSLKLQAGSADFGTLVLSKFSIDAPAADQAIKVGAVGTLDATPFSIVVTAGALSSQPIPIDGTVQTPAGPVVVKATLAQATGGFRDGFVLRGLTVTSPNADVTGDASLTFGPRRTVTATLTASRIDLDAIQSALIKTDLPAAPMSAAATSPPSEPKPERRQSSRIFSDKPIAFAGLRDADADVRLAIGTLRTGGEDYRKIETHVLLAQGKLSVDPMSADLPEGHMDGTVSVDASQANPPIHLHLHAPGLALKPLLVALRQPPIATGNVEIYADLDSAGATPHAIAGALDGSIGIAIPGGTIDNRIVGSILGRAMNDINALDLVGRGGSSELRCFATRLQAKQGVVTIDALTLNSGLITVTGDGSANLGAETLDVVLRPEARIGGANLVVPVHMTGAMRNPATKVDRISSAEANIGSIAGALMGRRNPLGTLGGILAPDRPSGDGCAPALAAARGQAVAAETPAVTDPAKALRSLLR